MEPTPAPVVWKPEQHEYIKHKMCAKVNVEEGMPIKVFKGFNVEDDNNKFMVGVDVAGTYYCFYDLLPNEADEIADNLLDVFEGESLDSIVTDLREMGFERKY